MAVMTIAINWRRIQFHFFNDFKPKKKFWKRRRKTIIEKKNDKSTSFFYSINLCNVEVFDMEHRSGIKTKVYFLFFFFFSFVSFRVSLLFHKKKREEERRRRFFFYFKNKTKKKKNGKAKINQSIRSDISSSLMRLAHQIHLFSQVHLFVFQPPIAH